MLPPMGCSNAAGAPLLTGVGMIPLRGRDKRVRAWAKTSLEDFARISRHRWHFGSGDKYVVRMVRGGNGKSGQYAYGLHREVMGLRYGDKREVDHRNRQPLDNTRENLRICTRAENAQNLNPRGLPGSSSEHRGVSYWKARRKWIAQVVLNHRRHHLGYFDTEAEAVAAVEAFYAQHMPFAARWTA